MVWRLFLLYALVELTVVVALVSTVGWGWTLLVLLATALLGWGILAPMAGSHLIHRIGQLRSGLSERRTLASDGAMLTLAMGLVMVPGMVTTALGLLLLVPSVRAVAAPALASFAIRGLRGRVPLVTYATAFTTAPRRGDFGDRRDYIDGEVIDVYDAEPPALPNRSPDRP
ncbi:membrane protein FxsA [Mycobacterium saskatchewanense]|uniref:Exclusion suppressor FxsA n=1 Tax=Mycobacterium saskatchewanense TaxID=220927 RepID=A0AAJ3NMP2_9MYCO|nr:FxsA family protein [Mycobacterium saskatchewanense]ORW69155.1 exclusion suppressor FxsA [Mycobacterium saskatchewanense]BBX61835.1 membrane protein FxsA [Mycobacterium saskatchewanense]